MISPCVVLIVVLFIVVAFMLLPKSPRSQLEEINESLKKIADNQK